MRVPARRKLASLLAGAATLATLAAGGAQALAAPHHAAASGETLVFYSAQGYDQAEATAFQKATGIRVQLSDMSTGPLLTKVAAERQHPEWDVIWFDGNGAMASLDSQGALLRNWTPASVANYNALGKSLLPSDHAYFPTGVTAAGAIAYNRKYIKPSQVPHSWLSLLNPMYHNEIGMNNPAISGPTYPLVAGLFKIMGPSAGEGYFRLLQQNGLHIFATNGQTLQALLTGTIHVAMFQDSAELNAARQPGSPIRVVYPSEGVAMLPSDVAINAHAPDMAAAKAFVNFVLSPAGQRVMQDVQAAGSDSLFQPVTTVIKPLVARPGVLWERVNPVWAGKYENAWVTWFTNYIVR